MKKFLRYKQIILFLFFAAIFAVPSSASAAFPDIDWGIKITIRQDGLVLSETDTNTDLSALTIPNLIRALNKDRETAGLHPLRRDPVLEQAAALKAADMVANKYFAHSSPNGINPWHWFRQAEYDYYYAGENLALDFDNARDVQSAWMNSPKHKENILNPVYEDVGYAIAHGTFTNINGSTDRSRTGIIIVQLFGKRLPSDNALAATTETLNTPSALGDFQKAANNLEVGSLATAIQSFSSKLFYDLGSSPIAYQTNKSDSSGKSQPDYPSSPWQYIALGLAAIMITASTRYALI